MGDKYKPSSMSKLLSWKRNISDECHGIINAMLKGDDGTNAETMAAVVHNCLRWASQDQDGKRVGLPLDLVSEKDQTVVVMLAAVGLEMIIEDTFQFPPWGAEDPPLVEPGRLDPKHLPAGHKDKPSDR